MRNLNNVEQKATFILHRLLIVFFFVVLIVYGSREVADLDLWLHLKTGEVILKTHTIPAKDIFSFAIQGRPWINHEWLFQTLAHLVQSKSGWDGLIMMQNIVLAATFIFLLLAGLKEKNHVFVFIVLYLTLLTTFYRFTIRPDIFSLFFLALYLFILNRFIENQSKTIWLLPLIQIFWINMHGFAFMGAVIILIFLICELIKRTIRLPYAWNQSGRLNDQQIGSLLGVFALMILASLLNPYGLNGAIYPFSVLGQISGEGRIVFQYIQELARPISLKNIFDLNFFLDYKVLILASLFSFRFNHRNINISNLILWLFFLFFSFLAIRNVAYFAIIACSVIFANFNLANIHGKVFPTLFLSKRSKIISRYVLIILLFYYPAKGAAQYLKNSTFNFDTYQLKSTFWGIAEQRFPKKGVEFLLNHDFPSRMFNDFNSGSYLIGQAYPKRTVFIDGRTELYGPKFFKDYVSIGEGKADVLQKTIDFYHIEGFFLTIDAYDLHMRLIRFLFQSPQWKVVYFDDTAIIFLKDTVRNAALINKFRIDLKNWEPREPEFLKIGVAFRFPQPYLGRARLLEMLDCNESAAKEARIALEIMPNNADALRIISDYYLEQKKYLDAFKYARNCIIYSAGNLRMKARLCLLYHFLKEDDKAIKGITGINKKYPKFAEGYYVKAQIVEDTDRRQAMILLKEAITLAPKEPRYHFLLGDLLEKNNEITNAKKEWKAAYEYDGANEQLKKKLGLK